MKRFYKNLLYFFPEQPAISGDLSSSYLCALDVKISFSASMVLHESVHLFAPSLSPYISFF
jgi:hypothetical protein